MKRLAFLITAVVLLVSFGCSSGPAFVAVREARFRSETNQSERIKLPLTSESRKRLARFFRAGGDNDLIGKEIADPDALGKRG